VISLKILVVLMGALAASRVPKPAASLAWPSPTFIRADNRQLVLGFVCEPGVHQIG